MALRNGLRSIVFRGSRRLVGTWRRWTRWEFWPRWLFYPPLIAYILWLALRCGGLSIFTVVNTRIWAGGVVGHSKAEIMRALGGSPEYIVRTRRLAAVAGLASRLREALGLLEKEGLEYPVVLKPDMGARGDGVAIVRGLVELEDYLAAHPVPLLIQEYAPGAEFGVFYLRYPGESRGRIFSITDKRPATVVGDGVQDIEELVLSDPRAVAMAQSYRASNAARWHETPIPQQRVFLSELGTHCRGAIFFDGSQYWSAELEASIDRLSRQIEGFHFGRYDLRVASLEAFRRGEGYKVIELNGLISEAAHIYDPRYGLIHAYRVLGRQWRHAAAIGRQNLDRGERPFGLWKLVRIVLGMQKTTQRARAASNSSSSANRIRDASVYDLNRSSSEFGSGDRLKGLSHGHRVSSAD